MSGKSLIDACTALNFHIEDPYFQALHNAPVPILITRDDGLFLLINRAAQTSTGYTPQEIPNVNACVKHLQVKPSGNPPQSIGDIFKRGSISKPYRISIKTKNDESLIWELYSAPLGQTTDGYRTVISIAADITEKVNRQQDLKAAMNRLEQEVSKRTKDLNNTISALQSEIAERKRMGEALTLSQERLKKMSRHTLDVLEADRRTVSKELHDSIGASLAAIKFSLEEKEMKRSQENGRLDEPLAKEITYLMAAIKETKRISANLRPTTLDDLGLMATVQWYLRQFKRMYGNIRVDYASEIDERDVPEAMKIIIYRIVQEGLTNAEKHSDAKKVKLQLKFTERKRAIALLIEDNGRGFNVEETLSRKDPLSGYGLTAMRERCEIFGGSFHIESRIGEGTKINAILPISL